MYQEHPWLIWSNLWRMPLGPHVLDVQEDLYRAVLLTGLRERAVAQVAGLVEAQVFGAARSAVTDTSVSARTGVTADDYGESRAGFWTTYYSQERYPAMTRIRAAAGGFDDEPSGDSWLLGLKLLLDGVEQLAASDRPAHRLDA